MKYGINPEDKEQFEKYGYNIRNLSNEYSIKIGSETCALIGISNLLWSNRRAELFLYLSKDLEFDVLKYIIPVALDKYLSFICDSGIENIVLNVSSKDAFMLYLLSNTKMNYIGMVPYYFEDQTGANASFLFEYYPQMKKKYNINVQSKLSSKEGSMKLGDLEDVIKEKLKVTILDDKENLVKDFAQTKAQLPQFLYLEDVLFDDREIKAVSPQYLLGKNNNITDVVAGYIEALTNREKFSIPLGEDKYIIQEGNGKYGVSKQVLNFDYILLDKNNKFAGFCNRLSTEGRNARIDIGIHPKYQRKGYGSKLLSCYYDELFRIGYLALTSYVFDFNEPSIKLHEKYSKLIGVRKNSYYANGKLWNMNIYVKEK